MKIDPNRHQPRHLIDQDQIKGISREKHFLKIKEFFGFAIKLNAKDKDGKTIYVNTKRAKGYLKQQGLAGDHISNMQIKKMLDGVETSGKVSEIKAGKSYTKLGEVIPQRNTETRIQFAGLEDNRLAVRCYEQEKDIPPDIEIVSLVIKNNNDQAKLIYINLDDMANRLQIGKSKIKRYAKEGKLDKLLKEKADKLSKLATVINHYEQMIEDNGNLDEVQKRQLMKTIRNFSKCKEDNPTITFSWKAQSRYLLDEGLAFLGVKDEQHKLVLINVSRWDLLGKGSYGAVYKTNDFWNSYALKIAHTAPYYEKKGRSEAKQRAQQAVHDVKNEYIILKTIRKEISQRGWNARGLQKQPRVFVNLTGATAIKSLVGYLGHLSLTDLYSFLPFVKSKNPDLYNTGFNDLLVGLTMLHNLGYVHGDIKLQNIFVDEPTEGPLRFVLADMGGARKVANIENFSIGVFTAKYNSLMDRKAVGLCRINKNSDEFQKLMKARDVFQLGCSIYKGVTGKLPYKNIQEAFSEKYPNYKHKRIKQPDLTNFLINEGYTQDEILYILKSPNTVFRPHKNSTFNEKRLEGKCTPRAIALLKQMCNQNPDERISSDDLLIQLHQYGEIEWFLPQK